MVRISIIDKAKLPGVAGIFGIGGINVKKFINIFIIYF